MTALEGAKKMMAEKGRVIVGIAGGRIPEVGETLYEWCGYPLPEGHGLKLTGRSNRAAWDTQRVALFGKDYQDPNIRDNSHRFFAAELVSVPTPDAPAPAVAEQGDEGLKGGSDAR